MSRNADSGGQCNHDTQVCDECDPVATYERQTFQWERKHQEDVAHNGSSGAP